MKHLSVSVLVMAIALAGCTVSPDAPRIVANSVAANAELVRSNTKIAPDPHAGWTRVVAPAVLVDNSLYGRRYVLLGWVDPSSTEAPKTFQLQVSAGFPKRVYLKQAYALGRKLETVVIDRERMDCGYGCTTVETVGIVLAESELEQLAVSGLALEVIGRRKTIVLDVPPAYFASFLASFRQEWERQS